MKQDIDRLMADRQLDALLIAGDEGYSVVRDYLSNGAHITGGVIVKPRGSDAHLFVSGMEIEEAKVSGLPATTFGEIGYMQLLQNITDPAQRTIKMWELCLKHAGIHEGTVGLYGTGEINVYVALVQQLSEALPQYRFVGEVGRSLFDEAMLTKDADELARLRDVARRTNEVLEATWDYIAGHRADVDGTLRKADDTPLTISEVKRFVRQELLARELEDTGMIFAQGRDAGYPHSRGQADMPLKLGQSIVFDLFPREMGGGYHHDITRTWCIGYAPDAVQRAYDQVMQAFDIALETFGVGKPAYMMQEAVLDYFEANDHPTQRSDPGAMAGYVHSLGHGLGLQIHERPSLSHVRREDVLEVGNCISVEPGLYYPEDGYGIRVEDTCVITEKGELVSLSPFRKDLILPLRG